MTRKKHIECSWSGLFFFFFFVYKSRFVEINLNLSPNQTAEGICYLMITDQNSSIFRRTHVMVWHKRIKSKRIRRKATNKAYPRLNKTIYESDCDWIHKVYVVFCVYAKIVFVKISSLNSTTASVSHAWNTNRLQTVNDTICHSSYHSDNVVSKQHFCVIDSIVNKFDCVIKNASDCRFQLVRMFWKVSGECAWTENRKKNNLTILTLTQPVET